MIILLDNKFYVVNAFEYNKLMADVESLSAGSPILHDAIEAVASWVRIHPVLEGVQFDDLDGRI